MEPNQVLSSIELLRLEMPSRRDRDLILNFLEALTRDPCAKGDYEEQDEVGRAMGTWLERCDGSPSKALQ